LTAAEIFDAATLPHVVEHLALDEADLRARVRELEADLVTYRDLLRQALAVAHDVTTDRDRLRERYHQTLTENRTLREALKACELGRAA
jgi:hypothetical protein